MQSSRRVRREACQRETPSWRTQPEHEVTAGCSSERIIGDSPASLGLRTVSRRGEGPRQRPGCDLSQPRDGLSALTLDLVPLKCADACVPGGRLPLPPGADYDANTERFNQAATLRAAMWLQASQKPETAGRCR